MDKIKKIITLSFLSFVLVFGVSGCKNNIAVNNDKTTQKEINNQEKTNKKEEVKQKQETKTKATTTEEIATTSIITSDIDTSNWKMFNSKDFGLKLKFALKYPNSWLTKGSIDGGTFSSIPFYLDKKYSKVCKTEKNGALVCKTKGKVFEIKIFKSMDNYDINLDKSEKYYINDIKGYIINDKINNEKNDINPFISKEINIFSIPEISGMTFNISMINENKTDEMIFKTIIQSIKIDE